MTLTIHEDLIQGSDEWLQARCGLITASEVKLLLTPTGRLADNAKTRAHLWELAAQRITGFVEPQYISDAMLRGHEDEILARAIYAERYAPVEEVGFVTNDKWGFTLGCSPDGMVGEQGMIECKSRCQKYQVQTIVEEYRDGVIPEEYRLQVQTALLVTDRSWCDFISYSGGMPMAVIRVMRDVEMQAAIIDACAQFEARIAEAMNDFAAAVKARRYPPTERRVEAEMVI